MLTDQELQSLRNMGNEAEAAADEIQQLRAELSAERENHTHVIDRLQQAWEDTRTQRDELLAHIAGKTKLPQWAADWLKA